MPDSPRVLFIFLDGVGVGSPDAAVNPFLTARLPNLKGLLNEEIPVLGQGDLIDPGPSAHPPDPPADPPPHVPSGVETVALPLDALMGVEGLPQSGTGQMALLTGENAAELYGRHFGPWVPVRLRPLMAENNVLSRVQAHGISCVFANAYPSQFVHRAWTERPAGPPLAAHAAGLLTRSEKELARGEAVSSEIVNAAWRTRLGLDYLPEITPEEAGRNLARISGTAGFTFFAHYSTDTAGHERSMKAAVKTLERVDAFLGGVIPGLSPETLLVLASDHGNIEDLTQGHTRNPTLSLFRGPGVRELADGLESIMGVPGLILRYLTGSN